MASWTSVALLGALMATVSFAVPVDEVPSGVLGFFDYINSTMPFNAYGGTAGPNAQQIPGLAGSGLSSLLITIQPCSILLPHNHPRAAEMSYVTQGTLEMGLVDEFGTTPGGFTMKTFNVGQGTLFPQGLLHYQQNTGCTPAAFLAVLNAENPGTDFFPTSFFQLAPEALGAALGLPSTSALTSLQAGTNPPTFFGPSSASACMAKCGKGAGPAMAPTAQSGK